jgi:acetyl-CoA/propionyl-CoA carboxylase biotin carboxyl carrier protein
VAVGESVQEGDLVVVLEAMKMEQPINAHKAGKIKAITAEVGTTVPAGTVLLEIED